MQTSLSISDIVVLSDKGKNTAYYLDSVGWEKMDKFFDYVHTRSAAISNYKGMTAFGICDDKLYLGKTAKTIFSAKAALRITITAINRSPNNG